MSVLGAFSTQLHGKVATLRTSFNAHVALTATPHGATVAATASRLVIRDAAGRAQIAAPSVAADIATKGYVDSAIAGAGTGTVTSVASGTGLTGGPITSSGTLSLSNTGVTPGSYALPTLTIDAQGRITAASNGSAVTGVSALGPLVSSGGTAPQISMPAATAAVNGYMSATYAAKLDGIQAGAQVNSISSVFGRTGAVNAQAGDYAITQITGVTVSQLSPSGGADGHIWYQVP